MPDIQSLAQILDQAAMNATPVEQLSAKHPFTVADAYDIQSACLKRRYDRGEKFIGLKMGFTSKAKMEQMGVHDMIWGCLTDKMLLEDGGELPLSNFIHPRAEPEICFRVHREINRELVPEEIPDFVDGVAAALEIIDSRYQNFRFSLEDVIADNCSSAALVVGKWHPVDIPVDHLPIQLEMNGEIVQEGNSSAILGNPWASFQAATRLATQYGLTIPEGAIIMAGAATPAVYLGPNAEVIAHVAGLGIVSFKVR